jgi:sugar/nucleoside kinase (ribokinase family)
VAFPDRAVVAQRGANARLAPADVPDTIDAHALLISGFALFQSGSDAAARAALERFGGPWAGVDLASPKLATGASDVVAGANLILATADEARALTGLAPEEAARSLAERYAVACVKLGEDGAIAAEGDRLERCRAEPGARSSPFGAGDAFGGAFLVALADGAPLARALELACKAGARAVAQPDT